MLHTFEIILSEKNIWRTEYEILCIFYYVYQYCYFISMCIVAGQGSGIC